MKNMKTVPLPQYNTTDDGERLARARMFADEMEQEELEKDECYGCTYGYCGPCIGICYKSTKA